MFQAIPTTYAGVRFRSRLEARWAAFFDLCRWRWSYETFDLPGWIPDFLAGPVLVEVKPATDADALEEAKPRINASGCTYTVWLVGIDPDALLVRAANGDWGQPWGDDLRWAGFLWWREQVGIDDEVDARLANEARALWREAGNRVQWRRPT